MDVYDLYTYTSAAWLVIQGVPLAFSPRYILSLAETATTTNAQVTNGAPVAPVSDFTLYALRALGGLFLLLSALTLSISISAPPSQIPSPNEPRTPLTTSTTTAPPSIGSSILPLSTMLHLAAAAWAYRQYMTYNSGSWFAVLLASGVVGGMGVSAMLFGDESRPGRGSRWPFESKEQRDRRKGKWEERKEKLKKGL